MADVLPKGSEAEKGSEGKLRHWKLQATMVEGTMCQWKAPHSV